MSRLDRPDFILNIAVMAVIFASSLPAQDEKKKSDVPQSEMLTCKVLVLDPDGNPVEDATVTPSGLRTKVEPASHWGWSPEYHGPLPKQNTDKDGLVEMPYPKYVNEKLETGTVTWSVQHPDFVDFREDRSVDDDPAEIKLVRGYRIALTAVNAETGEKITTDLYAAASGHNSNQWKLHDNGMLVSPVFAKEQSTLRVMQIVAGRPILFSESIDVDPEDRSRVLLKDVKLSNGTRVEGKLADSVERPIQGGYVAASINTKSKSNPNSRDGRWGWSDKTPIAADGTFVFESLPPGEVLQMIPICDGWVPSVPKKEIVMQFFPGEERMLGGMTTPQLVKLDGEKVSPVLEMEKAAAVRVTVKSPQGDPLPDAKVFMWPNQYWFNSGSQILGAAYSTPEILVVSRNGKFEYDRTNRFSATTDENGIAIIENLPAKRSESLAIDHREFDMPLAGRDRQVSVLLTADKIVEITVQMEVKGSQVLSADAYNQGIGVDHSLSDILKALQRIFNAFF